MFAEQQREYLDKGYTKIESFFSAEEVAKILEDVKQIELGAIGVASDNETYQFEKKNGETTKLLRRVENPHLYFDAIDSLVRSEKVVDLLRHFLGENIRLHNSKINFKPPSGAPVQWHQDWAQTMIFLLSEFSSTRQVRRMARWHACQAPTKEKCTTTGTSRRASFATRSLAPTGTKRSTRQKGSY